MTPERWRQVTEVFHAALARDVSARAAYLDRACVDDRSLREEVEAMLAAQAIPGDASLTAMPRLASGTMIGPYRIAELIGAGGMGEVYRATDLTLKRHVALKVVPAALTSDPDRLARFQREAELLASLNHPHIAQIYGLEESAGTRALVMELVEGATLADRVTSGALPLDEALPIARQIAEALEAAHDQGIIHRDLKPANIKVRPDGTVKVLDFGLAKAIERAGVPTAQVTPAPTITSPAMLTGPGVMLGTAAYMSPEQAKGQAADKRSDMWAFGCVLYEMLAGVPPFEGEDVAEVLNAVIRREPDWLRLPAQTPTAVRSLIRGCLTKDRRQRVGDIAVALFALNAPPDAIAEVVSPPKANRPASMRLAFGILLLLVGAAATFGGVLLLRPSDDGPANLPTVRFDVSAPSGVEDLALSPDGRYLAYVARAGTGPPQLYVRRVDAVESRLMPGTENAAKPFWSPDSTSIGFSVPRALKRISIAGSSPLTICVVEDAPDGFASGGAWNRDDVVLFGARRALYRVPASGGTPEVVVGGADSGISYRWPQFLPDGRRFLVFQIGVTPPSVSGMYAGSLDSPNTTLVLTTDYMARYSPPGVLLHVVNGALVLEPFDLRSLKPLGGTVPLTGPIRVNSRATYHSASFAVSDEGSFAYSAGSELRQLAWVDRAGNPLSLVGPPERYYAVELSPDGSEAAVEIIEESGVGDIWALDLERATKQPVTRTEDVWEAAPHWSPDGRHIAYAVGLLESRGGRGVSIRRTQPGGSGGEDTFADFNSLHLVSGWSPDGLTLFVDDGRGVSAPLQLRLPDHGGPTVPPHARPGDRALRMSPDGRFVAFVSSETGRDEIYVRPTSPGRRTLVSTNGGSIPRWRRDGRELYYRGPDNTLLAVSVDSQRGAFGAPELLFRAPMAPSGARATYSTVDGSKFLLMNATAETSSMTWVINGIAAATRVVR